MAKRNKLSKLTLDEVSLVDRPCNPEAQIVLFKRAPDPAGLPGSPRQQEETQMTDKEKAELVKLRFFVGMTIEEAAAVLGISEATAKRWWIYARAWLHAEVRT